MTSQKLEALAENGYLKPESGDQAGFGGLVKSGRARLIDARNIELSI
jgi:hypothetical protein